MANWKELGVVPDSDEEDFVSEDDSQQPLSALNTPPRPQSQPQTTLDSRTDEIWKNPALPSPPLNAVVTAQRASSPNCEHSSTQAIPDATQWGASQQTSEALSSAGGSTSPLNREQGSPDPLAGNSVKDGVPGKTLHRQDGISTRLLETAVPPVGPFPTSYLGLVGQDGFPGQRAEEEIEVRFKRPANPRWADIPSPTASEPSAQGRRSLRPRKPIQEHPYLLENAQYSKAFKSHGLKPIRIEVAEQAAARRRHEEASQDTEYAGDASQSGGPDEESQNWVSKAKKTAHGVLDDNLDELALSQSPKSSSPPRLLRASSDQSPGQLTDETSVHDDEDFPDIRHLTATKKILRPAKRRAPLKPSTSRKRTMMEHSPPARQSTVRTRADAWDLWDSPCSPGPLSPGITIRETLFPHSSLRPPSRSHAIGRSTSPLTQPESPSNSTANADPIDPIHLVTDTEEAQETSDLSSDGDSDMIRRTGRRIRGVLPASWLRLDQQTRANTSKLSSRRPNSSRSPGQPRQGIASRKAGTSKSAVSTKAFLDELNEDDDEDLETHLILEQDNYDVVAEEDIDDGGHFELGENASLVEEDHIDRMLPGQKRNRTTSASRSRKRNKTQPNVFTGKKRSRQPKISESMHRLGRHMTGASKSRLKQRPGRQPERAISPPALSIVDFIEPSAPAFIKVAARAARMRTNMGRSKPSFKSINLGNRADNLDALAVLRGWKIGKIKQRTTRAEHSANQSRPTTHREPLRPVASNTGRPAKLAADLSFHKPQKLTRQGSMANYLFVDGAGIPIERRALNKREVNKSQARPLNRELDYRPAQLEAEVLQGDDKIVFGAKKKVLDLVFRKSRNEMLAPTFQLRQTNTEEKSHNEHLEAGSKSSDLYVSQPGQHGASTTRKTPRPRKRISPRRLDLAAPEYLHANDPLPFSSCPSASAEEEVKSHCQRAQKITGLGPIGTYYTQDFDVFPLHRDTFFHDSTIIGNGILQKALDFAHSEALTSGRAALSFVYLDYRFVWGRWTASTSSEVGLLFDAIAEDIEETRETEGLCSAHRAVDGAENVLKYVLDFFSAGDISDLKSFTQRMLDLLDGFVSHTLHSRSSQNSRQMLVQIASRYLMCALVVLRFCQSSLELSDEAQDAEIMLGRLAKFGIEILLTMGTSELRTAYDDLSRVRIRERGIRADNVTMISWVVVIKVLRSAQIPRTGFWDLISSTEAADVTHVNDAQGLETLWRDIFTLLPLTEFDDAGITNSRQRHVEALQGWILPQKLLKIVFESYEGNERQSPTFNNYVRALLGRCHCLIEQWGWQKSGGVIGTIFDFFGGQNLSHLRNEEVYDSPRFLEKLSEERPCVSVEPEDCSFHILLKILAVAIRKMSSCGHANDIRNLIARCLPNHSRQYSKELPIHSHDLASLRNHHDLLCTLFWAAPAELRRPVGLIERLVQPANSHKEAILINLRAWRQLARFVVASGSSIEGYRPFVSWQNNVFQQVLNQYLFAATDVEHQFMAMAKEDRGYFQQQLRDKLVAANQDAAKEVLHFSVRSSLDVLKHCPSLTAAVFSFNVSQTAKVFSKLGGDGTGLDWSMLRDCFDTVDVFVEQIEKLWSSLRESSSDSVSTESNRELENAIEFLDDKIMQSFMAAVRRTMMLPLCGLAGQSAAIVVERAVSLCGRIANVLIDVGKCSIAHFFSAGKYSLFGSFPDRLSSTEWRFVPLFVATLLQNHYFDFSGIGCSHFHIWMFCLVKPSQALRYEVNFAAALQALDLGYMTVTGPIARTALDYDKNRTLFADGISYMRKELRQADLSQRKLTRAKYERLLRAVMQQIKADITSLKLDSAEHSDYISFVREIVGLIRSHGSDICSVDPFFYEVSAEYSPPSEDPQMHTASILAYGIKIGEGEMTAVPTLFSFLYNHFKTSLSQGQLDLESKIVENGMGHDNILGFVLGCMLPAIIQASSSSSDIWPLLDTYSKALQRVLTRSCWPREIQEGSIDDVVVLLTAVLDWVQDLRENSTTSTANQAHIFTDLLRICNAVRPSVARWLQQDPGTDSRLQACVARFTRIAKQAATFLEQLGAVEGGDVGLRDLPIKDFICIEQQQGSVVSNSHVHSFTKTLVREVQNNWVVTSDTITVRVATDHSTQGGAQATQGVKNDLHSRVGLSSELLAGLKSWVSEMSDHAAQINQCKTRRRRRYIPSTLALDPF